MIRRCAAAGLPEPEFAVTDGFVTTIRRAALVGHAVGQAEGHADQARGQVGQAEGQADPSADQAFPSTKDAAMLRACDREAVPGEELLAAAGYPRRTGDFRRRLERLLDRGLLKMTLPDRPRSPLQKYRLTARGKAILATSKP